LAFVDVGAVISMEHLQEIEEEMDNEDTAHVEFSLYFILLSEY